MLDTSVTESCTDEYLQPRRLLKKNPTSPTSFYDFWARNIDGDDVKMSKYEGKVVVVVNAASGWGLTHQNYAQLGSLYEKHAKQGFRVAVFHSTSFNQESLSNKDLKEWNNKRQGKNFDIYEKIAVNGVCEHPLYKYLKEKQGGNDITWNYNKFLIDGKGKVVKRYGSWSDPSMEGDIANELKLL